MLVDGGWFEILCRMITKAKEQISSKEKPEEDDSKPKKYMTRVFRTKETGSAELLGWGLSAILNNE